MFELVAEYACSKCGRPRPVDGAGTARTVASGDAVVHVRTEDRCEQCGDTRIAIRPRVAIKRV